MRRPLLTIGALAVLLGACEPQAPRDGVRPDGGRVNVFAVNYPLYYFAERIGGDAVQVTLPAPPGVDPAHWSPDAETVADFQSADVILLNGAGYARWVTLASLPRASLADTTAAFRDRLIPRKEKVRHVHGPEGRHVHGDLAFTTWLDPTLAALQARAVADALAARRPEHAEGFESRLAELLGDLDALDRALARAFGRLERAPLIFSHPVYEYLEARYDLNGRSLVWEPDELPDEREWRALLALLEEHPARTVLWESEPLPETAERLAAIGIESVVFSPCASRPERGDWLTVMQANLDAVQGDLRTGRRPR